MSSNRCIEVELKFRVADVERLVARLEELAAGPSETQRQTDVYYRHPCRDFAATDEALRIRQVQDESVVTYKGPKSEHVAKTRQEIEVSLGGADDGPRGQHLLEALGFSPVLRVEKQRQTFSVRWQDTTVAASWDRVEGLGDFVELEMVVSADRVADAQQKLLGLASELGLRDPIRTSYLEMLLSVNDSRNRGSRSLE